MKNENITQKEELDEKDMDNKENEQENQIDDLNIKKENTSFIKEFFSWVKIIVVAIVLAFTINNVIIINANVPSGSMENTIMTDSRMIGLRTAYWFKTPQRGEVIIFKYPDDERQTYVKRVIGMPGEKVTIKDGKIYINDSKEPLKETYLKEDWTWQDGSEEYGGEMVFNVPKESYFVLGDNRNNSKDSRLWVTTNYVKESQIIAKAEFVYWPWVRKGILETPEY